MLEKIKERLTSFGYSLKDTDNIALTFSFAKVEHAVKNDCNISNIPEGLEHIVIDMTVGEFLLAKKTFAPGDIAGLDLDYAVKQIQTGDTNTVFTTGDGTLTAEQRLDALIQHLLTHGRDQFSCYRRLAW